MWSLLILQESSFSRDHWFHVPVRISLKLINVIGTYNRFRHFQSIPYMYTYIYMYIIYMCMYMYIFIYYIYMCIYICIYIYVGINVCIDICVNVCSVFKIFQYISEYISLSPIALIGWQTSCAVDWLAPLHPPSFWSAGRGLSWSSLVLYIYRIEDQW